MKKILSVFLLTLTFAYAADTETNTQRTEYTRKIAAPHNINLFMLYLECACLKGCYYSLGALLFFVDYVVTPPLKLIDYLID